MAKNYVFTFLLVVFFSTFSFGQSASKGRSIEGFAVFPNPVTSGFVTIKTTDRAPKEISIYNVLGKRVFVQKYSTASKQFDISSLNSGIYIMKVIEGDKIETKKLVIR